MVNCPINKHGATLIKVFDSVLDATTDSMALSEPIPRGAADGAKGGQVDTAVAISALRAFASMARLSQRHQAEVEAALHRAGISVDSRRQAALLRYLADEGCIDGQIPLSDGATILTVTAVGMSRAGLG